ncbi:ABC transporter ATP-binding protein [Geomonas sp. Red32]|uniref:ABC transporter ATP-binding protein n=1 Tax=Geomonas sp. Red32 TaxID=2912856 RepID=UPI00202D025A|nr:ABC transporter ATP-binding protein [Geomonas sp. Red32]MCM0083478.1 ABC transporter ATP-binding protein [Geomonas sp. Red32]
MTSAISVDNLAKKYLLTHQAGQGSYLALRDVLAEGVKSFGRRVIGKGSGDRSRSMEEFWALKGVSFEVKQGERVGIIGRNGAGKSTLLKIISRITEPTTGSVRLRGRVASLLEVGTGFHPELTGRENIYLNGAILGMGRGEIRRKFDEIVDFAETERFLDTPVKRYSSGMYVRLAFAVAAHLEPEILVVDEVLAVGDAQFQQKCLGKMEQAGKEGRTVLFVSHQMGAISRLCGRAILLGEGAIAVDGDVESVTKAYLDAALSAGATSAERCPDPDKPHQITGVSICKGDGTAISGPVGVDEQLAVQVRCRLQTPLPGGYAVLAVKDLKGEYVLFSDSRDHDGSATYAGAGEISATVTIPAPLLAPGRYSISAYIGRPPTGTVDACIDALTFEVEDLHGVRSSRPGHIYLPLQWQQDAPSWR